MFEQFISGYSGFSLSSKTIFQILIRSRFQWTNSHYVEVPLQIPIIIIIIIIIVIIIIIISLTSCD